MAELTIGDVMGLAPVIPVLVIDDVRDAIGIGKALVAGGLPVLEVTLRTPAALDVIRAMAAISGAVVGAGTVLNRAQFDAAVNAGARFVVSPGLTAPLASAAAEHQIPLLPGVATASDLMRGLDQGLSAFKFFPAVAAGGIAALKALAGPFSDVVFCPTGGITQESAGDWLAIPQVRCVGGSWIVPRGTGDLAAITSRARLALDRLR